MFNPSDRLKKAISENDVQGIRWEIIATMQVDAGQIRDIVEYVISHGISLFEPHDADRPLIQDRSQWDDNYIAHVIVDLMDNFSEERYWHWLAVAGKSGESGKNDTPRKSSDAKSNTGGIDTRVIIGAVAAAVIIGVVIFAIAK